MTNDEGCNCLLVALEAAQARGESVARIQISYRIWEALTQTGLLDVNPWRGAAEGKTQYKGIPVLVREFFDEGQVVVTTHEQVHLCSVLDELRQRALRATGLPPVAYELGTASFDLLKSAMRTDAPLYQGIPIRVKCEVSDHVGVLFNAQPPDWCVVGACIARQDDDTVWGKVQSFQRFVLVLEDLEDGSTREIPLAEVREKWHRIPDRIVPANRFLRVLGGDSVLE